MGVSKLALRITNSITEEITLHLEPWGEQYVMKPGSLLMVTATGPDNDILEVEYGDRRIAVYGWSGSNVSISSSESEEESCANRIEVINCRALSRTWCIG